jgi:UDPglucose--hexose-1-phosphate uridylyltransferase
MPPFSLTSHPHRRLNLLTGEWMLVSPHRTQRPWSGQVEEVPGNDRPQYDPTCYLCPRNTRSSGETNPSYASTYVFDNDFMALLPDTPAGEYHEGGLLVAAAERGLCRVICFSPRHDLTLAQMTVEQLVPVVDVWAEQTTEIGARPEIGYVQVFGNKGEMMGCSNPHPHGQVWATEHVPNEPAKELRQQEAWRHEHDSCLLCDYLALELEAGERIVCANEEFVALVPFWACWPFETMVLPRRHAADLPGLTPGERHALADILRRVTVKYDNLFRVSFPYSMGWHQQPTDGGEYRCWHLHAHFYPPLLRSATVRKFMVGFEMLATPQRDITPEAAAQRLRELSEERFA